MSHISKIELEVNDLRVLSQACTQLGLKFVRGQRSFKWFGEDSECNHAIIIPEAKYEIGVVRQNSRYDLVCDYYDPKIEQTLGRKGGLLKQAYAVARTKIEARRKGYSVVEQHTENGIRLRVRRN